MSLSTTILLATIGVICLMALVRLVRIGRSAMHHAAQLQDDEAGDTHIGMPPLPRRSSASMDPQRERETAIARRHARAMRAPLKPSYDSRRHPPGASPRA